MTEQCCLSCRFWERKWFNPAETPDEDWTSNCLRYPPTVIGYDWNILSPETSTPETLGGHWCGEWQEGRSWQSCQPSQGAIADD